jgi:hypothetical protein
MKGTIFEPVLWWLYSAIAVTGLCGILYVSVQQSFRQNLDDPQIQIAEDAAQALEVGELPAAVVPRTPPVDLRDSLSSWVAVYDSSRKPLESSGVLDNAPPVPPEGTFNSSTWTASKTYVIPFGKETRFTWQAAPDVRQATVLIVLDKSAGSAKYIAVGRNMREIESRITDVGDKIFIAWLVILAVLFVSSFIGWHLLRK